MRISVVRSMGRSLRLGRSLDSSLLGSCSSLFMWTRSQEMSISFHACRFSNYMWSTLGNFSYLYIDLILNH